MGTQDNQTKQACEEDYAKSRAALEIKTGTIVCEGMIPSHLKVLTVAQSIPIYLQGPSSPIFKPKALHQGLEYLYVQAITEGSTYPAGLKLFLVNYEEGTALPDGVLTHIQPCDHRKMPVDRVHYMYSHNQTFDASYLPEFEYTSEPSTTAFGWLWNIVKCTPKITPAFVRQCLTVEDQPAEAFIEAHADQIDIRYQNYLPVRSLFKTHNRKRIEFFLDHIQVPSKVLVSTFWMLCSEGEALGAELALEFAGGVSTREWDTECNVNLGRVAATGWSIVVMMLAMPGGGNECEKLAYALCGAISGSHTDLITVLLDQYTKIDLSIMTPDSIKLYRRCARGVVYCASKIDNDTQFFAVLTQLNEACRWGMNSGSMGFYYSLDLTSYRKNRLKTDAVPKILKSCLKHKTQVMAKILVSSMMELSSFSAPVLLSPASLFAACKIGDADTIQFIFDRISYTDYDAKVYEEALLVCSTEEAITKLLVAGKVTISASNIATIKDASPLIRECVSSYLEQLARKIRSTDL